MHYKAFILVDILIGIVLSSFLIILLTMFIQNVMQYSSYIRKHQQLRTEIFAIISNTLPRLIREAAAIDYSNTTKSQLSLFTDKMETKTVLVLNEKDISEDASQLIMKDEKGRTILNSTNAVIEQFIVETTKKPRTSNFAILQQDRILQPMVRIKITARYKRSEGARTRTEFSFFENPRISYETAYTLRNYSLSSFRFP